jgi:hypothetical protein
MANYIKVTLRNGSATQHLFLAKDTFLKQDLLGEKGTLLDSSESVEVQLGVAEDNYGHIQYRYSTGVSQTRDDVMNGDTIDMT